MQVSITASAIDVVKSAHIGYNEKVIKLSFNGGENPGELNRNQMFKHQSGLDNR